MLAANEYLLGHADPELERLQLQARCLEGLTRRLIKECGIEPGMRVLDLGSPAPAMSRCSSPRRSDLPGGFSGLMRRRAPSKWRVAAPKRPDSVTSNLSLATTSKSRIMGSSAAASSFSA